MTSKQTMDSIILQLAKHLEKLPGIGPRQAQRFVYYLLNQNDQFLKEFSSLILSLKNHALRCNNCQRFFDSSPNITETTGKLNNKCPICKNSNRDKTTLLVVEKDIDLENLEKAGFYNGQYYVLGGLVPALGKDLPKEIKMRELFEKVKKEALNNNLKEIILGLNATLEGDNTARYIEKILEPIIKKTSIKASRLGRGLSSGTELEYSDRDTIINALKNRK